MIICPDNFRVTSDGKYDPSPEGSANAWRICFDLLNGRIAQPCDSPDRLRRLVLLVGPPGAGKSTWAAQWLEERSASQAGTVVFDATFSRRIEREPLIEIAKAGGVHVDAIVFLTPISICIARNWIRPEDRRVPYPVIASMLENLRREPVTVDEGFDCVQAVRS